MEKNTIADATALSSIRNGAVIETTQEYLSATTNDKRKESNGRATDINRQISKTREYDIDVCKFIPLAHLQNPVPTYYNIDKPAGRLPGRLPLRIRQL